MHHGSGAQNMQRQLQRSKSFTNSEADEQPPAVPQQQQQASVNLPQSPATSFAPAASPSAPQSPNYQIIMSRSPVTGANMNITLQNVGTMVPGGQQQITLTSLPLQSPASPGFQHSAPQWRFEQCSSSYIQVASPLPQPVQPQSPTQHSPATLTGVQRAAPTAGVGVCGQSPPRFVDAGVLVRQIGLGSPTGGSHFVYQDAGGLAQLAPATVPMASPGTPGSVRERRLSQPHSQTGGTIHHLGPQSPAASGTTLPALGSPGHITTSNLPPQISSIIQGQLARPMVYDKTSQGMVTGVGPSAAAGTFGLPSSMPPSSPSRSNPPQGIQNPPLAPAGAATACVKKQPKKLEEIAPASPEVAQLRKQCLDHHTKKMESLKEVFKEYLVELFFLQHLQGNMMDYLAFKKKPCVPLFTYLRQNDLDLEDEEEEEQSEVINDEAHQGASGAGITNPVDIEAFKRQQALAQADQAKRPRIDVGRHGIIFQHHGVTPLGSPGVPLQQLMPTAQGGMPPTPQAVQIAGQKQSQQQYDPSKGPPVQNAASLHTPPPQLPARLPPGALPVPGLPLTLSQPPLPDTQLQAPQATAQLQAPVKVQASGPLLAPGNPHTQLQAQLHSMADLSRILLQTVALVRPASDPTQSCQRLMANSLPPSTTPSAPLSTPTSLTSPHPSGPGRPASSTVSPVAQSKQAALNPTSLLQTAAPGQTVCGQLSQESSQDKQAEQLTLEGQGIDGRCEIRLPKLLEAPRPKSHWDYLLQEMQWMAADFAQERRWKMAAAKKLVRTCARFHDEQKRGEECAKRQEEMHLRQIAGTIAREVEFFWSNIEQARSFRNWIVNKGCQEKYDPSLLNRQCKPGCFVTVLGSGDVLGTLPSVGHCVPAVTAYGLCVAVEDEESTIEEQEATEVSSDQQAELAELSKEAEMPLDILVKQYAGAYSEDFNWPQPCALSTGAEMEEPPLGGPHEAVLIDSLLSVEQYRGPEKPLSPGADGKPQRDIAEVAAATELLLPKGLARITSSVRGAAPFLLHGPLREYQQIGVDWLISLHKRRLNGILADETGLGKTVQLVAFLAHLACQEGVWGPHLVVVRTCKLLSWEMEFKRWCPGLKILLYLGGKRERRRKRTWWSEPNSLHVCVTSYKLLFKDQKHFLRRGWSHLVLDEVQLIKDMTEKHWDMIFTLRSHQRLLLINTPLQNTLKELWTMVHFLLPGITRPYLDFPIKPGTDQNQDYCHKLVIRLHRMIQPFILRRSKRDVEKQLPKKYEHILKCRLSCRQKSLYEDVMTQPGAQEALKTGHFVSVLQVLMQLQRICNHPDLVHSRETVHTYVCAALEHRTASVVLGALAPDPWKTVDLTIFDLISNENKLTRYETEVLPKLRVTQQLIEEIHSAPDPPPRPKAFKIKPMRLFQPVQYGMKPEGRTVPMTSTSAQRTPTSTAAPPTPTSAAQPTPVKSGDVVKIAQLASITGGQGRISQPETPVTLQFQGNKFTLSPSQLRQLTTGQPLQLQGNILQIVSAPGQQMLRPPSSVGMQAVPQALPAPNATPLPAAAPPNFTPVFWCAATVGVSDVSVALPQESSEERMRQTKERLGRLFVANERRCARAVLYGADLLQACCVCDAARAASTSSGPSSPCFDGDLFLFFQHRLWSVVPVAVAPPPCLYASNPPPRFTLEQKLFRRQLQEAAAPHNADIRRLASTGLHQFPDLQLLQMDSGKLEALAVLLHKLRSENRRVLIFTQMVRMLDILEAFLNHRQLTYVRLDESLPMEERQEQMKYFNRKRRVFCAILTNRCCSAVGHVFDADTIVFYDTDLNPSMDARTQEWCDRIGRSKDIHIYRLESGNSIEEKLLKNGTKDLIREVAAQGTDYTVAFLTQRTIQDLFEVESGTGEKVEEFVVLHQEPSPSEAISPRVARPYIQALNSIGQDSPQELGNEGDSMGEEEQEARGRGRDDFSRMGELAAVIEQLTPIEKYALQYLEYLHISEDEERAAQVSGAEERMILEEEEDLFTYTREDAYNMEYVFEEEDGQTEIMPLWTPPTPPQDDNDIYIDSVICLMYDTTPMPESKLPPVYIRKEHKRLKMDPSAAGRKKKKGHGEVVIPPRSLFDKPSMLKVRREGKDQKKNFSLKQQAPFAKPLPSLAKPATEAGQDSPEWLISEDWALLQAVKHLLELPLNLTIVSPAHTPNWDLVSDVVNSCSRIYRSPKQCRNRYENVIIPREEGKSKNSRPLRTCQIYSQDDNATQVQLYNSRFELMKMIASKRSPPIKPLLGMNPFQKNPKHASVLAESGISYDKPLPPIQVASQRAERIAKEKKVTQQQQQQQQPGAPQAQAALPQAQTQPQAPAASQPAPQGVPQPQAVAAAPAVPNTAVLVRPILLTHFVLLFPTPTATVSGNVIVNTVAGVPPSPFQANKRLASPIIPGPAGGAGAQVVHTQQRAVPATAAPTEVVAIATGQGVRAVTPATAPAVVSTSLTPVQTQTRSLVTPVAPAAGMQLAQGKQITQAHLQMLRQQQLQQQTGSPQIKQQQQQQQQVAAAVAAAAQQTQQTGQSQASAQATQPSPQLTAVAAPRAGAVLTAPTVANLQVARLTRVPGQGQIQATAAQTAQVTLTKASVVSMPTVVSSPGVISVSGISVPQKPGGQVVTHSFQQVPMQQLMQMKKQQQQQVAAQQKAVQPQQAQAAAQQKPAQQQQQKVTYATAPQLQPGIKTQFFTTSIAQAQKPAGAQQIQVAKLPQIVQQQSTVANIQQIVSAPQQAQAQTVSLSQPTAPAAQSQVQVLPAATSQVVQQKLLQQQVATTVAAGSPQVQTPPPHSPAPQQAPADPPAQQQAKGQARTTAAVRVKPPAKPSGGT
uniref:E1A binding protein p400 n=1 Tax=Scleropages formosus TaxID=113540 RepID=A0A8C9WBV5_SCLFO